MSFSRVGVKKEEKGVMSAPPAPIHIHRHYDIDLSSVDALLEKHECAIEQCQGDLVAAENDLENLAKFVNRLELSTSDEFTDMACELESTIQYVNDLNQSLSTALDQLWLLEEKQEGRSTQLAAVMDDLTAIRLLVSKEPLEPSHRPFYLAITLSFVAIVLGLINVL